MRHDARSSFCRRTLAFAAAWISVTFLVLACAAQGGSTEAAAQVDQPALLLAPSPQTHHELERAVSEALNGASVRIADDALTSDSYLIITRAPWRDAAGQLLIGRITERPERFDLVKRGAACILIQERTTRRWLLHAVRCAPRQAG